MTMHTWGFTYHDNGGGRQFFKVKAANKPDAIEKGHVRAEKKARGDCIYWDCKLIA